jgi:hypothetical protein
MRRPCAVALLIATMGAARAAWADDVVQLSDGTSLTGEITEMKRGSYVIIKLKNGVSSTVKWAKVANVLQNVPPGSAPPPPAAPAPPAPAPAPAAPAPAATPAAAPSPPPPGVSPRVSLQLRDGRTIVGTLLSATPTQGYSLVTDDGKTMRLPFDSVAGTTVLPSRDRVVLDDGTTVDGVVTVLLPGASVTIGDRVVQWARVRDVVVRKKAADLPPAAGALAAGAAAGASITTTTQLRADTSGASYDITRDCTGGPDTPMCHERTHIAMGAGGPTASYESEDESGRKSANISASGLHAQLERDCAANSADERCTEKAGLDVGANGKVGLGYSKVDVTRVKTPPSGSVNFNLDVGATLVFLSIQGTSSTLFGTTADLSVPILLGGKFPGATGGSWFGIKIEPFVGFSATFGSIQEPSVDGYGGGNASINELAWLTGGKAFLQYLHFGTLDEKTLKQSGFGIGLGGSVGVQGTTTQVSMNGQSSPSTSSTDSSIGPAFALTFPSYNAGTAHYSATNIIFLVVPTGSATIATVSAAFSF